MSDKNIVSFYVDRNASVQFLLRSALHSYRRPNSRAVESAHKSSDSDSSTFKASNSDSDSSIFKTPTPS
jgi:hypothetical protein